MAWRGEETRKSRKLVFICLVGVCQKCPKAHIILPSRIFVSLVLLMSSSFSNRLSSNVFSLERPLWLPNRNFPLVLHLSSQFWYSCIYLLIITYLLTCFLPTSLFSESLWLKCEFFQGRILLVLFTSTFFVLKQYLTHIRCSRYFCWMKNNKVLFFLQRNLLRFPYALDPQDIL